MRQRSEALRATKEQRSHARTAAWLSIGVAALMWLGFPMITVFAVYGNLIPIWQFLQYLGPFAVACAVGAAVDSKTKWGSRWDVVLGRIGAFSIVALGVVLIWYMTEHPWGWS
ncbi:hypothetical protein [Microbacterium sp. 179-I 3D4 NHS]|uniref:hypothetical protein n=1 Tax=Microbacterium sp. 179-I 3D4 NHS TaxID=3142381 RepID=UPI0039A251F2